MRNTDQSDREVLAMLRANDGALLGWQLNASNATLFADALRRGVISEDAGADLYVHVRAEDRRHNRTVR